MSWVSPTGYEDPDSKWDNEPNAYDENTDTNAISTEGLFYNWTKFLILTISAITCNKVRFNCEYSSGSAQQIDLDVYKDGAWVDVYEGAFSDHTWVEKTFTQGSVSKVRMRFWMVSSGTRAKVWEFDFWQVSSAILKEVTDSISLAETILRNKTLTISDSVASLDSLLAHKTLQITDAITVLETILRDKTFTVSDSIGLSELITVITGGILKEVLDTVGLSEQVKIDKSLIIQETISILDQVFRHKPEVSITDAIALAEIIAASKLFTITDAVSIADVVYAMKTLPIYDQITVADQVSTPTRILQALDAIGLSDTLYVNKTLIITDQIALAEVVEVGKGGVQKTKLFLILGDLAIQIQG